MLIGSTRQGVIRPSFSLNWAGNFSEVGGTILLKQPLALHDQLHAAIAFNDVKSRLARRAIRSARARTLESKSRASIPR